MLHCFVCQLLVFQNSLLLTYVYSWKFDLDVQVSTGISKYVDILLCLVYDALYVYFIIIVVFICLISITRFVLMLIMSPICDSILIYYLVTPTSSALYTFYILMT